MRFFPPTTSNNLKGSGMIFYCKDCEKVVDVIPVGRKFVYKCAICKTKNVAFGTDKSIRNFFHVEEEKPGVAEAAAGAAPAGVAPTAGSIPGSAPAGTPVPSVAPAAGSSTPSQEIRP